MKVKFDEKLDKKALKALNKVCVERDKHFHSSHEKWLELSKKFERVAIMFEKAGDKLFAESMRAEQRSCKRRSKAW